MTSPVAIMVRTCAGSWGTGAAGWNSPLRVSAAGLGVGLGVAVGGGLDGLGVAALPALLWPPGRQAGAAIRASIRSESSRRMARPPSLALARHLLQPLDALLQGRVGRKEAPQRLARERVDDVEVGEGRLSDGRGHDLAAPLKLAKGAGESQRVVADLGPCVVGLVFTRAGDGELYEQRGYRPQDQQQQPAHQAERTLTLLVAAASSEEEAQLGEERDRRRHHRDHRTDEDVPVSDVGELVSQHAVDLLGVQDPQQALVDDDRGVAWVAAGGKRVRVWVGADVDTRLWHAVLRGEPVRQPVQLRRLLRAPLLGLCRGDGYLVAGEVRPP